MFFGNKKSSIGRMTENDADLIAKHVLTITTNVCGKNDSCPPPNQLSIRKSIAYDLALYLSSCFIFRLAARRLFETVKPEEITEAADLIANRIIINNYQNFVLETKIRDNLEYYAVAALDLLLSQPKNEIRGGIIAYTDRRIDLFGINEMEFDQFSKDSKSFHFKSAGQQKALAIFKFRILDHYSFSSKDSDFLPVCFWVERFSSDSILLIDKTIEKLSCK
jgi:hypothetical protein